MLIADGHFVVHCHIIR